MNPEDDLIFASEPTWISFRNRYWIYRDRIELEAKFLFRKFVIRREQLVSIAVFPPPVMKTKWWALKLDCADIREHVGIERTNGFMKFLRFTPEDPYAFVALVKKTFQMEGSANERFRATK